MGCVILVQTGRHPGTWYYSECGKGFGVYEGERDGRDESGRWWNGDGVNGDEMDR